VGRTGGIVAAGHEAVATAGAEILAAGGNAFDAVVACGFASAVAEPGFTSLAGGGFLLARTAAGDDALLDFFVDTPGRGLTVAARTPVFDEVVVRFAAAEQRFHCGLGSVAVPGCLPGYLEAHRRFGRLDLATVVAPAVHLAGHGVEVSPSQAEDFTLLAPIFDRTDVARALFFRDGRLLAEGDVMHNADLAAFIEQIGAGHVDGFRRGPASDSTR
jgi:gamma-glutamyltranspeptidase/glutathione hydrolase